MNYLLLEELVEEANSKKSNISDVVLKEQALAMEMSCEEVLGILDTDLSIMEDSAKTGGKEDIMSTSKITGGEGYRMSKRADSEESLAGDYVTHAIAIALSVADCNAAMGKIVAAPTAGSCGVLPGAIIPLLWKGKITRKQAQMALVTAGAVGMVIANNASISGAEGGCQAECGSASAMAAAALTELMGGSPEMCINAAAMAIKNQLGLVCDPVAGLVEVPCIKRNAGSVTNAITSAEMALAGITSVIPPDEVISAMASVGDQMSDSLKETAKGGLAATKTGKAIKKRLFEGDVEEDI